MVTSWQANNQDVADVFKRFLGNLDEVEALNVRKVLQIIAFELGDDENGRRRGNGRSSVTSVRRIRGSQNSTVEAENVGAA